jgi:hypothetical protein
MLGVRDLHIGVEWCDRCGQHIPRGGKKKILNDKK